MRYGTVKNSICQGVVPGYPGDSGHMQNYK